MNIFKALFQAPKLIEAVINTGDALVWTDEERKNWIIESAKVLGPQTIARRLISVIVTVLWSLLTVTGAVLIIMAHTEITAYLKLYTDVSLVFGSVMVFYFGAHLRRNWNGEK